MNKIHGLATIVLALSVAAGCGRSKEAADDTAAQKVSAPAPMGAGANAPAATATAASVAAMEGGKSAGVPKASNRALVVTMDMSLVVKDVDVTRSRIKGQAEEAGGYIADGTSSADHATMEVRVPATKVGSFHESIRSMGELVNDNEKVQDVTEERADLQARLTNARFQEKRVLEIMQQRTGSIGEVIAAENELSRIRENIERMEAQKRSMDGKIELATIRVNLSVKAPPAVAYEPEPAAWQTPGKSIAAAAKAGGRAAAAFAVYAVMAIVASAPFTIPLALLFTIIVYAMKNKRKKQLAAMTAA